MNYEERIKTLAYRHIQALDRYAGMPESVRLDAYTEVVHPHREAFMEAVEEAQREIDRLGAINSCATGKYYEMDDVDRALVVKVREAIKTYERSDNWHLLHEILECDEELDALRLLLQIIDEGHAA